MAEAGAGGRVLSWIERRFNITEIFSFLTCYGLFPVELDAGKPLKEAVDEALSRPIPSYARWPRVLGILSILLFAFLALTGIMLAFYYQPTPTEAYESVTGIVRDVSFGWFVHQVHGWAATAFLFVLLIRLWRIYFQGLYHAPREGLWIIAMLTFLAATHADMTGRLLGWTDMGYWSSMRAVEILYALPVLGPLFAFLIGGSNLGALVLVRFYFLHVAVLPALLAVLFFLHFSGVRRVGLSEAAGERAGSGRSVYRVYVYNLLILVVLVFGTLITLATMIPAPYLEEADPFHTPQGVRAPWYLLASYGFMEVLPTVLPRWARALLVEIILFVCILVPFIDSRRGIERQRRGPVIIGILVLAGWLLFTWIGYSMEAGP